MGLPLPTHTHKIETKRIFKISNPKNTIEKTKGEKNTKKKK
jgi:hypothetical protein